MSLTRAYRRAIGGRLRQSIAHAEPGVRSWPVAPGKTSEAVDIGRLGCLGARLAQQQGHALHVLVAGYDPGLAIGGHPCTRPPPPPGELPLERRLPFPT